MSITSRQKAIIVGSLAGQNAIITKSRLDASGQPTYLVAFHPLVGDTHFNIWRTQELKDIDWDSEAAQQFLANAHFEFYSVQDSNDVVALQKAGELVPPREWLSKMSPLALAVLHRTVSVQFGTFSTYDMEGTEEFLAASFKERWGINLIYDGTKEVLTPESEDDLINLWLLLREHILLISPSFAPDLEAKYKRNHQQCYLSGPQQYAKDKGTGWRAKIGPKLFKKGWTIYNPVYMEGRASDQYGVNFKQLRVQDFQEFVNLGSHFVYKDRAAILASQLVLAYYDPAIMSAGTISEICITHEFNTDIVVVSPTDKENLPLWILGSIRNPNKIFKTFEEAENAISD